MEELYSSLGDPEGQSRCPKCRTLHDVASSRIPDRSTIPVEEKVLRKVLAEFLREQGKELAVTYMRCPRCGTLYETKQGVEKEVPQGSVEKSRIEEGPSRGQITPPESIKHICLHCRKTLTIPKQYAGQRGKCNKCGGQITAPD
jgi:phage FluMu protein Com